MSKRTHHTLRHFETILCLSSSTDEHSLLYDVGYYQSVSIAV